MVWQAYWKVRANKGGAGVDEMDWTAMDKNRNPLLYKLWNRLTSGSYFPPPVKEVGIEKKDGGIRNLGIPTILDRIAQEVVREHLNLILEPLFHDSSYGYRQSRTLQRRSDAKIPKKPRFLGIYRSVTVGSDKSRG